MTRPSAADHYDHLYQNYRWHVPADFNIAHWCCTRWANDANRVAIYMDDEKDGDRIITYAELQHSANQLSHVMTKLGVTRGDRVAIVMPQRPEVAVSHIACHQIGAIAMPMSVLFGPDALEYRLQDSAATLVITDQAGLPNITGIRAHCPALEFVIAVDGQGTSTLDWHDLLKNEPTTFNAVSTQASDPALLIYTSGTTGSPKGALMPQSALLGNLTGFVASQNWFPHDGDVFWSPADWAWTGGLMDALLPALYFGKPIVASRARFSAEHAFTLMEKYSVTNSFLFPTALKIMMKAVPSPRKHYQLKLRAIMSAGEAVGDGVFLLDRHERKRRQYRIGGDEPQRLHACEAFGAQDVPAPTIGRQVPVDRSLRRLHREVRRGVREVQEPRLVLGRARLTQELQCVVGEDIGDVEFSGLVGEFGGRTGGQTDVVGRIPLVVGMGLQVLVAVISVEAPLNRPGRTHVPFADHPRAVAGPLEELG